MGILTVDNLSLELGGKKIIDDLSLDFWEGNIHALVGPNGAGKSTLASTIMGLSAYRHFEGDLRLDGASLKDCGPDERARRGITLAWQEPARFEGLGLARYILAGAREKSGATVERCLQAVGMDPGRYLERKADKTLSGGERKRVELAAILAMEPRLVLMDEPDSGIDVEALERIFEVIRLLKERGATVILITHSMAVLKQAEHAFLLCHGKLLDKGSVEKIGSYFENKCLPCPHPNLPTEGELS